MPAIAASQFAGPYMISGVAVALPALGADLGAGATALSLVQTLFLAASVALLLPFGRLGDAADKVTVYKAGVLALALASIATGLVSSVPLLLALCFLQGVCSAAVQAAGPGIVADAVPPERRGRAFGIIIGSTYAGLTLGPVGAGFVVELWGWRAVFLSGGAIILLLMIPIHLLLTANWKAPHRGAVHMPSALLVIAAMLFLVLGTATLREGIVGYAGVALGLVLLAVFVFSQKNLQNPLLNTKVLMENGTLRSALTVQWLLYCNAFGTVFLLSLYMQTVLGAGANTAGTVIALGTLLMAMIAPFAGRLADRFVPAVLASIGVGIALVAALMATRLDSASSLLFVGIVLSVQGVGFAFFSSPNIAMVMNSVPPNRSGIAGALSATARSLGMVTGMLIVAAIISVMIGHEPVGSNPARFIATMQIAFWILAGVSALALVLSVLRTR